MNATLATLPIIAMLAIGAPRSATAQTSDRSAVPLPPRLEQRDPAVIDLVWHHAARIEANPTPANWRRLGMVYQANLEYELACQVYQRALDLDPASAPTHYLMSLCRDRLGDATAAIAAMEQVTVLDPTYMPAWWRLGLLQLEFGDLEEAELAARRAADQPAGAAVLARVLLQKGDRDEVVELLERQLQDHPDDRHLHMLLGTAYRQLGRTEDARRELTLGRGELPDRPDPWAEHVQKFFAGSAADRKRAEALMEEGRIGEAIEILEALRIERPRNVSTLCALAVAQRRSGQIDEAIQILLDVIDIQPGYDMAHFHLAGAYREKGVSRPDPDALEAALEHADTVVALSPTFAEGHALRADVLINLGRNQEAVESFHEAMRFDAANPLWPMRCGALCFQMEQWDDSVALFETVVELDPRSVQAWLGLASAHLRLGQLQEARSALQTVHPIAPDPAAIEQTLARIERALADQPESSPVSETDRE